MSGISSSDWQARAINAEAKVELLHGMESKYNELLELLKWADAKLGPEINPSNYDHQDVCELNANMVEVTLAIRAAIATESARDLLPETKPTGGANTLAELISLLKIARDNKTGVSLDWVETGIALRNLAEPAREIPKCTRSEDTECHAHSGDKCYNYFQCEPAREEL